ncbi:MAG: hypothetical protein Q9224_006184 [Gallowayella concinna]
MFTCKALEQHPKASRAAFGTLDHDLLPSEGPVGDFQSEMLDEFDYHLMACATIHFDIKSGWNSGLLAIALQRHPSSVEIKQEKGTDTLRAKFKEVTPRRILAKHVEEEIKTMEAMDGKEHEAWVYWLNFNEENNASGFTYKSKNKQEIPTFDELKAFFRAALSKAFYSDNIETWKLEDGQEIIYVA